MTYEISTRKGFNGWIAESSVNLGETENGTRKLTLSTSKLRGGIAASARVAVHKNSENGFCVMSTDVFGDFSKSGLVPTPCSRVTEKAVLDVHKLALQQLPEIIEEAKAFYEKRDAENQDAA